MAITKISDEQLNNEKRFHQNLEDIPRKSANDMKEFMDYIPRQVIIPKVNEIADAINNILPESEAAGEYAYTIAQTDELLSKKADKDELIPMKESIDTKVDAQFVEQKINEIKPADYIIEQGKSGYWNYEKWNSGKLVCYGKTTANIKINNALGSAYYSDPISVNFIDGFFNDTPTFVGVTPHMSAGLYSPVVQNLNSTGFKLLIYAPYSLLEIEFNISMYAVGKWK